MGLMAPAGDLSTWGSGPWGLGLGSDLLVPDLGHTSASLPQLGLQATQALAALTRALLPVTVALPGIAAAAASVAESALEQQFLRAADGEARYRHSGTSASLALGCQQGGRSCWFLGMGCVPAGQES